MDLVRTAALRIFRIYWWVFRPITLGVKGVLIDQQGQILLVRHTYQPGWHFPGGGVDRSESLLDAAIREVREEVGLEVLDRPEQPFAIYTNFSEYKSDHVAMFLFKSWRPIDGARKSPEIADWGFFSVDKLPAGTTPATLRRLEEIASKTAIRNLW